MKKIRETFKDNFNAIREQKGFDNLAEFSRVSKIPYRTLQDWIDKGVVPQGDNVATICRVLGVSERALFAHSEDVEKPSLHEAIDVLKSALSALENPVFQRILRLSPDKLENLKEALKQIESPAPEMEIERGAEEKPVQKPKNKGK